MHRYLAGSALVAFLVACTGEPADDGGTPGANAENQAGQDAELIEFQHEPPVIEEPLEISPEVAKTLSTTPSVTISNDWSGADLTDMRGLVDAAVRQFGEARWLELGDELSAGYGQRIWLTGELGYADSGRVNRLTASPTAPFRYFPAILRKTRGGPVTNVRRSGVTIKMNNRLLRRWRSDNPVVRGCAVNTMAHEISHTLSRRGGRFGWAFTDTGSENREGRRGVVASYFSGDLALCTYLLEEGRITRDGMNNCVQAWYEPGGFQSGRCFAFDDDEPIQWPRAGQGR